MINSLPSLKSSQVSNILCSHWKSRPQNFQQGTKVTSRRLHLITLVQWKDQGIQAPPRARTHGLGTQVITKAIQAQYLHHGQLTNLIKMRTKPDFLCRLWIWATNTPMTPNQATSAQIKGVNPQNKTLTLTRANRTEHKSMSLSLSGQVTRPMIAFLPTPCSSNAIVHEFCD